MKNLFIGNLPFGLSEGDLRGLFEQFGAVERVSIITDRETGKPRGFAFIEMSDDETADRAIADLNGKEVQGRALSVSEAKPKSDRSGGGGRRGSRPPREPRW
jgi:cold-inducible RNA-binding protein